MSLRSQNPYVVSKKGLFTTNTPGVADVGQPQAGPGRVRKGNGMKHSDELSEDEEEIVQQAGPGRVRKGNGMQHSNELPEDEEEIAQDIESSDDNTHSKHFQNKEFVGFYDEHDEDTINQFADVDFTRSTNNQMEYILPMLVMGAAMSVYEELPKKLQPEEDFLPEKLHFQKMFQTVLQKDNSMMAFLAKQDITNKQKITEKWEQIQNKYTNNIQKDASQTAESDTSSKTLQPNEKWTVTTNTCAVEDKYDCVHVCFTETIGKQQDNFYLFVNRSSTISEKYLILYQGVMTGLIRILQDHRNEKGEKVNDAATMKAKTLKLFMDELTRPDENGIRYFECVDNTDQGYWHDHARAILKNASPYGLVDTEKKQMSKFVHTIAKRLFLVDYEDPQYTITYNHDVRNHTVKHNDFHVIMRVNNNKVRIFFCAKEQQPANCEPCSKETALGTENAHGKPVQAPVQQDTANTAKAPAQPDAAKDAANVAQAPAKQDAANAAQGPDLQDAQLAQYNADGAGVAV
jgi:hypothetical protein